MGAEALALHLEGLTQDETIPEPSNLDQGMLDSDNRDGDAILVYVEGAPEA